MKKILITGGAGFIGSSLIKKLGQLQDLYQIISLDLNHEKVKDLFNTMPNLEFIDCSILDEKSLDKAMKNIDLVVHLAGGGGEAACLKNPSLSVLINVLGTQLIVKYAKLNNVKKIIFASSIYTYSSYKIGNLPIKETEIQEPDTFYGSLKLSCEEIIKNSGVNFTILRFSNIYGVGSGIHNLLGGAIGNFINASTNNTEITIFNKGSNKIDYVNIDDIISAIKTIIEKDENTNNEIYNLGGGNPLTILELGKLVIEIAKQKELVYDKDILFKENDDKSLVDLWSDTSKAKQDLNWEAKKSIQEGISEMIDLQMGSK